MTKSVSVRMRSNTGRRLPASVRSYAAALRYLNGLTNHERMTRVGYNSRNFNLTRMGRLLAGLDNPHRQLRCVHIAGTKGKGSTAIMLASMLSHAGLKTGLYVSPHMVDVRERIQINGQIDDHAGLHQVMHAFGFVYHTAAGGNHVTGTPDI